MTTENTLICLFIQFRLNITDVLKPDINDDDLVRWLKGEYSKILVNNYYCSQSYSVDTSFFNCLIVIYYQCLSRRAINRPLNIQSRNE